MTALTDQTKADKKTTAVQRIFILEYTLLSRGHMDEYSEISHLIEQLVSGNDNAWSYFIKHYGRLIYKCINKVLSYHAQQEDKEDCFQEIIKLLLEDHCRRLKQVHSADERTFRSWLGVVANRNAMNFSVRKMKGSSPMPEDILDIIPDHTLAVDQEILRGEITNLINKSLSEQERLVMLFFLEGLTLKEIAEHMDLAIGKVFEIKKRAIDLMKDLIREIKGKKPKKS